METFKKRVVKEALIALSIVMALLIILVFLGFRISKLTATISKNIQNVLDRSASIKLLAVLQNQYGDKGKRYLEILHNVVPPKDSLIDLQKDLQSLAAQENVGFGFTFLGETPASFPTLGNVSYRLNIQGNNLNTLLGFLRRLSDFHYINSVDSVSINQQDANMQMVVKGEVYDR